MARASNGDWVEIRVFWGETLLELVEVAPGRGFRVGTGGPGERVDRTLPLPGGEVSMELLERRDGRVEVVVPEGGKGRDLGIASAAPCPGGARIPVGAASAVELSVGALRLRIRLTERAARLPRAPAGEGGGVLLGWLGGSAGAVLGLIGAMAWALPPSGLVDEGALDRERLYLMSQYLDAAAEREREREPSPEEDVGAGPGAVDAPAAPAAGEAGAMGRPTPDQKAGRGSANDGSERPAPSRAELVSMASSFGMIGLLSSAPLGAVAAFSAEGSGTVDQVGAFFGDGIGEGTGVGGLALAGLGEGGGHRGDTLGLRSIGTCSGANCEGWGRGPGGPGRREHVAAGPRIRPAGETVTSGSLPPEVIQRVVRQSFGRFRGCYEAGLRGNPSLEGRVTARFVIARDGSVATVANGGSDIPDSQVVACVLRAYQGLTFPAPGDGVVRVSYPLMFAPAA